MTGYTKFPVYAFGDYLGPAHLWFAWRPVRLYYGKWVWLRNVVRLRVVKKPNLHGPDWEFWSYSDRTKGDRDAQP